MQSSILASFDSFLQRMLKTRWVPISSMVKCSHSWIPNILDAQVALQDLEEYAIALNSHYQSSSTT